MFYLYFYRNSYFANISQKYFIKYSKHWMNRFDASLLNSKMKKIWIDSTLKSRNISFTLFADNRVCDLKIKAK